MASLLQERLAEALTDPKVKTLTQAAAIAGYNHVSSAHRGLNRAGGQEALEKIKARKAASLSEIRKKTIGELSKRINPDASDQMVLGSLKVTTDALATMPEPEIDPATSYPHLADPSWVKRHRRRALLRAYNLGRASVITLNDSSVMETASIPDDAAIDAVVLDPPTQHEAPEDSDDARLEELKQQAALLMQDAD